MLIGVSSLSAPSGHFVVEQSLHPPVSKPQRRAIAALLAVLVTCFGCAPHIGIGTAPPQLNGTPGTGPINPALLQPDGRPQAGVYPSDGSVPPGLQPTLPDGTPIPHRLSIFEAASLSLTETIVVLQLVPPESLGRDPGTTDALQSFVTKGTIRDRDAISQLVDALKTPVEVRLPPA